MLKKNDRYNYGKIIFNANFYVYGTRTLHYLFAETIQEIFRTKQVFLLDIMINYIKLFRSRLREREEPE